MKPYPLLLAASLVANAALAWGLYRPATSLPSEPARSTRAGESATATPGAVPALGRQAGVTIGAADLARLLNGELDSMVAGLQAAGFSPDVIRAIVKYRVGLQFRPRLEALLAQGVPYWLSPFTIEQSEAGASLKALDREMSDRIVQLLGADYQTPAEALAAQKEFDYLPPAKAEAAQRLVADFARRIAASRTPAETTQLGFERRAALAELLNPEEYEAYNLRRASTSTRLRNQLAAFEPTEQEYLAIFRIERPIDEKYGGNNPPQRAIETKALQTDIAAALGADRYAEYQKSTDPQYLALYGLTSRLNLPRSSIDAVRAIESDVRQRATEVNRDPAIPADQKTAQIAGLTAEAESRIGQLMGPRGLDAYRQNPAGRWLTGGLRTP